MAKRAVRAKKRTVKRTAKKQSFFEKFFTFPRLAVFVFAALLIVFVHQVFLPGNDVKGASTAAATPVAAADNIVSEADANSYAKTTLEYDHFVLVKIWADRNGDVDQNDTNSCLKKTYTIILNGKSKTITPKNCDYKWILVHPDKNGCSTVKLTSSLSNWTLTGAYSLDGKHGVRQQGKASSVQVCGNGLWGEGFSYNEVAFGFKAK